jgi:hypothetical protein
MRYTSEERTATVYMVKEILSREREANNRLRQKYTDFIFRVEYTLNL